MKKIAEKYVTEKTFEKSMSSIAESFSQVNESLEILIKEIRTIHEDNKYFRSSISSLNIEGLSYDRKIENLTARVERLESKTK